MNNFLTRWFHREIIGDQAPAFMDRSYVSEHTRFIDQFVQGHPEVLGDQHDGRLLYWDKRVDLVEQEKAGKDSVPDDGYGFYYSAWKSGKRHLPSEDKRNKFPGWQ